MPDLSLLDLLQSGAHFGHKTSRWNPKMKPYIFTTRNDIHILDLEKTKRGLLKAATAAADITAKGGTILFIGTKRQSRDIVKKQALECGMPFINVRWLGGTFTNFKTIQKTVRKLEKLHELKTSGDLETRYTKKERLLIEREIEKLEKLFEGIKGMRRLPEAVFIADVNYDDIALTEAKKSGVKIIGIVDSNSNPDNIDYVIPCNDDATQAIELVVSFVAQAIKEAKTAQTLAQPAPESGSETAPAADEVQATA
jgi:small subunit ribosomal protein S2